MSHHEQTYNGTKPLITLSMILGQFASKCWTAVCAPIHFGRIVKDPDTQKK